jgi:hypothetical protein
MNCSNASRWIGYKRGPGASTSPPMEPNAAEKVAGAAASLTRDRSQGYPRFNATRMSGNDKQYEPGNGPPNEELLEKMRR